VINNSIEKEEEKEEEEQMGMCIQSSRSGSEAWGSKEQPDTPIQCELNLSSGRRDFHQSNQIVVHVA